IVSAARNTRPERIPLTDVSRWKHHGVASCLLARTRYWSYRDADNSDLPLSDNKKGLPRLKSADHREQSAIPVQQRVACVASIPVLDRLRLASCPVDARPLPTQEVLKLQVVLSA